MRSISDTIARLSQIRTIQPAFEPGRSALSDLPSFGSNPGQLKAHYYIPEQLPSDAPLVVVLHGCMQTASGYDYSSGWSKLARESGFALLFPEQQRSNNPNMCFNWFERADTEPGSGEVYSIKQMIDRMILNHGLDQRRIFITGLSAGGAMAVAMLAAYPETFSGGGIIAGLAYGVADTVPSAFDRMRGHGLPTAQKLGSLVMNTTSHDGPWPKVSVWHGTNDRTVVPANGRTVIDQWRQVHQLADKSPLSETVGGHTRNFWVDQNNKTVVEENLIDGMGHGAPLDADADGEPGPYMIDVGISSTRYIAAFWDIAQSPLTPERVPLHVGTSNPPKQKSVIRASPATEWHARADSNLAKPDRIKAIIEDAFRSAGLMK